MRAVRKCRSAERKDTHAFSRKHVAARNEQLAVRNCSSAVRKSSYAARSYSLTSIHINVARRKCRSAAWNRKVARWNGRSAARKESLTCRNGRCAGRNRKLAARKWPLHEDILCIRRHRSDAPIRAPSPNPPNGKVSTRGDTTVHWKRGGGERRRGAHRPCLPCTATRPRLRQRLGRGGASLCPTP